MKNPIRWIACHIFNNHNHLFTEKDGCTYKTHCLDCKKVVDQYSKHDPVRVVEAHCKTSMKCKNCKFESLIGYLHRWTEWVEFPGFECLKTRTCLSCDDEDTIFEHKKGKYLSRDIRDNRAYDTYECARCGEHLEEQDYSYTSPSTFELTAEDVDERGRSAHIQSLH